MTEDFPEDSFRAAHEIVGAEPTPPPTVQEITDLVQSFPLDNEGKGLSEPNEEQSQQLISLLERLHLLAPPIDDEKLAVLVQSAKRSIQSGLAEEYLENRPFLSRGPENAQPLAIIESKLPIYIDPNQIRGANSFSSWMGRGYKGRETVANGDIKQTSLEKIFDFARKQTPLPEANLVVYVTDGAEPVVIAEDSHRVAAAKLRNEPVRVGQLSFYKY